MQSRRNFLTLAAAQSLLARAPRNAPLLAWGALCAPGPDCRDVGGVHSQVAPRHPTG
jgi:hypothetical protein